ncbi:MAG: SAM-dependent chlorinase/fluorinase [FCB group bacterium]|nr:SAM-dependent chlorinase/fluorinase [FCB group bacterium]
MRKLIALITDFGISDPYAGIMKGVIKSIDADIDIVEVSHGVTFGNIYQACYFLESSLPYFPSGTVFVVIVDPGVGSDRYPIACRYDDKIFIAPDNGCLSPVLNKPDSIVRIIENDQLTLPQISSTFHGRDIFAPAAAHLAAGFNFDSAGPVLTEPVYIDYLDCKFNPDSIEFRIRHIDKFGNIITNIPNSAERSLSNMKMMIAEKDISFMMANTFSSIPARQIALIKGSSGYLEIVENRNSAAETLDVQPGDKLTIRYIGGA